MGGGRGVSLVEFGWCRRCLTLVRVLPGYIDMVLDSHHPSCDLVCIPLLSSTRLVLFPRGRGGSPPYQAQTTTCGLWWLEVVVLCHCYCSPPLCDIPSACCSFTGPWTVTRSSLHMLHRVAAFCRPLRPVLLLVSFPRLRSPVVGVPGLCWMWHGVPFSAPPRNQAPAPYPTQSLPLCPTPLI